MSKKNNGNEGTVQNKLPKWFSLAWSSSAIALSLNVILGGYITFYCTDILGLNAGIMGVLLLVSKLIDGVTDMIVGFIIEKTHTRLGKARPYELFGILMWLFTVLMFSAPKMSDIAQYVYIFIMYMLVNSICATFVNGCNAVYLVRAVPDKKNQISVLSISGALVIFMAIVFNILFPQLVNSMGTTQAGWTQMVLMVGIPLGIIGMGRFVFCKEVVSQEEIEKEKKEKMKVSEMIRLMFRNKYIWLMFGMILIVNIVNNLSAVNTYYFKYIVGNIGLLSIASLAGIITPFLLILFPVLTRKFGTTRLLQAGMAIGIIGMAVRTLGGTNLVTIVIGCAFLNIGVMPVSMMYSAYVIDSMDYGEWKNGKRIEGPLSSVASFATKVGSSLASGVTGLVMGLAGYNGVAETQTKSALTAIVGLYNWFPLILFIIAFGLAMLWKLDKLMPQIRAELEERRKK